MGTRELDQARKEAFGARVTEILNHGFLAYFLSLGHQTGIFEVMAEIGPSGSKEIADASGLSERYVREWLGGCVVGGIVEYEPRAGTYELPPEHAAWLTRAAGPDNLGFFAQYLALIGQVEQEVVEAFRSGGGVPYSSYPRFQQIQAEETARVYDAALVNTIVPLVSGIVERLEAGIEVLDAGTGQGHAVNLLARAFPRSRFVGIDISEEGIAAGQREARAWGLTNASFEVRDAADLRGSFDLITALDVIHDLAQPTKTLTAIGAALREGGVFLMGDIAASSNLEENIDHELGPMLYGFSLFYCMTTSLAQGGEGLGTVWGEQQARAKLAEAGFKKVETRRVPGDVLNLYYVCTT